MAVQSSSVACSAETWPRTSGWNPSTQAAGGCAELEAAAAEAAEEGGDEHNARWLWARHAHARARVRLISGQANAERHCTQWARLRGSAAAAAAAARRVPAGVRPDGGRWQVSAVVGVPVSAGGGRSVEMLDFLPGRYPENRHPVPPHGGHGGQAHAASERDPWPQRHGGQH